MNEYSSSGFVSSTLQSTFFISDNTQERSKSNTSNTADSKTLSYSKVSKLNKEIMKSSSWFFSKDSSMNIEVCLMEGKL